MLLLKPFVDMLSVSNLYMDMRRLYGFVLAWFDVFAVCSRSNTIRLDTLVSIDLVRVICPR
jgi:hypothetical protein